MADLEYFDKKVLNKYNTAGPRYTSYPTALSFHDEFTDADARFNRLSETHIRIAEPGRLLVRNVCMSFEL